MMTDAELQTLADELSKINASGARTWGEDIDEQDWVAIADTLNMPWSATELTLDGLYAAVTPAVANTFYDRRADIEAAIVRGDFDALGRHVEMIAAATEMDAETQAGLLALVEAARPTPSAAELGLPAVTAADVEATAALIEG